MLLFCIRSLVDNLCRCMLVCCPMHFVLILLEKQNGTFSLGVIINAGRINLQYLPPEYLFRRPDIPDSGKQFIKVVAAAEIFQAVIIQHKALFHELLEDRGRPHAELNTALRLHTISKGKGVSALVYQSAYFRINKRLQSKLCLLPGTGS